MKLWVRPRFTICLAALWVWAIAPAGSAALLEFGLNEGAGQSTKSSSGLLVDGILYATNGTASSQFWSPAGEGVSGLTSDFSFETTSASGMGTQHRGPHVRTTMPPLPLVSNLTITGWFRSSSPDLARAALLGWTRAGTNISLVGLSGGPSNAVSSLRFSSSPPALGTLDAASAFEPLFSTPGQWAFFAVVLNSASATVTFVRGSKTNAAAISSATGSTVPLDISEAEFLIGSRENFSDPFQGHLDDIIVFSEALTLEQIEQVRLRSLTPERLRLTASGDLKWPTLAGRIYHLERSMGDFGVWEQIAPSILGDGQEYVHPVVFGGQTNAFYRLRVD